MTAQEYISTFKEKSGRIPSQVELTRSLNLPPDAAIRELRTFLNSHGTKSVRTTKKRVPLLSVGLLIIAGLTFGLSVYFTGLWFLSMFGVVVAGSISVSMVSYMVLSPQAAAHVKGVVKVPLWGTFLIALVFSMGSTVAGQYNKLTSNIDVTAVNERALLDSLKAEEQMLIEAIELDTQQRLFHQRTLESLSQTAEERIENFPYIATERNMVDELGREIFLNQERLREVRARIQEELARGNVGATVERDDFYSWFANLVGAPRNAVEFWVSVLPAVFIDVIAALSLNLGLAMRRSN